MGARVTHTGSRAREVADGWSAPAAEAMKALAAGVRRGTLPRHAPSHGDVSGRIGHVSDRGSVGRPAHDCLPLSSGGPAGEKWILGLDLLRAFAACWVVLTHGEAVIGPAFPNFPKFGFFNAVDAFFVLSGFLIGRIILRDVAEDARATGWAGLRRFWARRWLRTVPAYWAALVACWLLGRLFTGMYPAPDWRYVFFLQSAWGPHPSFFPNAWSLCVEEWFYLLFPAVVLLSLSVFRLRGRSSFLVAAVLLIVTGMLARALLVDSMAVRGGFGWRGGFLLFRIDAIAFGAVAALVFEAWPVAWRRGAIAGPILAILVAVLAPRLVESEFARRALGPAIGTLSKALWLPLFSRIHSAPAWFAGPVRRLSQVSYSMYLVHVPLVLRPIRYFADPRAPWACIGWYVAYFVLTAVATWLLWRFVEGPGLGLRERLFPADVAEANRAPVAAG